jgi:cobalt-zinc-cadmium resistance protein CzcA
MLGGPASTQPRIIYGVVAFALLAVVGLGATIGREFLPDLDEGALWLQVQMPTGCRSTRPATWPSDLRAPS